ncbi:MAG: hypothetical protein ACJ749_07615 [Flavisolibacter sp.]
MKGSIRNKAQRARISNSNIEGKEERRIVNLPAGRQVVNSKDFSRNSQLVAIS